MRILALLLGGSLLVTGTVRAQVPPPEPPRGNGPAETRPADAGLTPDELPVSLERIQRKLARRPAEQDDSLRLSFYVEVYGRAPAIDLFEGFDLKKGPVPYGGPTHAEFLQVVTPREFRSPPADLSAGVMALVRWLSGDREK